MGVGLPVVEVGKHAPEVRAWLEKPDKLVTRAELWEMLGRYENGRRRLIQHYTFRRRLGRFFGDLRRVVWHYLSRPIVENDRP